nr:RecName: Full=Urease subunit alpha; AltName: Full=Urea amidohydrolase subunit alpha [Morganella morganii]
PQISRQEYGGLFGPT